MGTRNLTKVIKDGNIVVAQYGQWDGYPSGQGTTAFYAIQKPGQMEALEANIGLLTYPSDEEREKMAKPFMDGTMPGMMTIESGKSFSEKYPSLTRDTGADILNVIAEATAPVPLYLDIEFEQDDLFCEGVYEVNLDNQTYTSKFDDKTVVMTFDEIRSGTVRDYLSKFDYEDDYLDELVASINRQNQMA